MPSGSPAVLRDAVRGDEAFLGRMLAEAWRWDATGDRDGDEASRAASAQDTYVTGFGRRPGDLGLVATRDGRPVGAAWCRLFDRASARRGFVSEHVPELAVAVEPSARDVGIGRALLVELLARATAAGRPGLSLHVHERNARARHLYASLGFIERRRDDVGLVLLDRLEVAAPDSRYGDGTLSIRSLREDDLEMDLGAKDDAQIDWLWEPGDRQHWESMTPAEQRTHARRGLKEAHEGFGPGPKWRFAVDTDTTPYVAYVDCDLKNPHVPVGEANVAYSCHPAHRGRGYVSGGVRLALGFLAEQTSATDAHVLVDERNVASLRVARAVGAREVERFTNAQGRVMVRHVVPADGRP